ncbi:MAG: hypothetical protein SNJ76_02100 [Fimbriimonadaceae bacterium]
MRKYFIPILSIVVLAFVVGCGAGGSQTPQKIMQGDYDRVPGAAEKTNAETSDN